MQNIIAEHFRLAVPRNQRIRKKGNRCLALVRDTVLDREQIFVVHRDGTAEFEPFAVVKGQRHRAVDAERARSLLCPDRVGAGQFHGHARRRHPAEFRVKGLRAAGRRQQHDRR